MQGEAENCECFEGPKKRPIVGEVIVKISVVLAEKIKAKVYINYHEILSPIKPPTRLWFFSSSVIEH